MVAKMKPMPTDDKLFGKRRVDGSVIHPIWLYQLESPKGSKAEWNDFTAVAALPVRRHSVR
jgi:hypothetical protein